MVSAKPLTMVSSWTGKPADIPVRFASPVSLESTMNFRIVASLAFLAFNAAVAQGDLLSFGLELNSGGSPKVTIDNRADPGWAINSVTVDFLAANVMLDTTVSDGVGSDPVVTSTAFLAVGTYGTFSAAVTLAGLTAYDNAGNVPGLISDINTTGVPGCQMTFGFSSGGILPGDGWGFVADWDQLLDDSSPRGADINGTTVTVTFQSLASPLETHTLSYTYQNVSGNGVSYPGLASFSVVPEPACGSVLAMTLVTLAAARRRRPFATKAIAVL